MKRENGRKKNITLFDPRVICYLDDLRTSKELTWDETLRLLVDDNRQDRDKQFNLKLKELEDWVRFAYPDRLDIAKTISSIRTLVANPFLLSERERMVEMSDRVQVLQRDLLLHFREVE